MKFEVASASVPTSPRNNLYLVGTNLRELVCSNGSYLTCASEMNPHSETFEQKGAGLVRQELEEGAYDEVTASSARQWLAVRDQEAAWAQERRAETRLVWAVVAGVFCVAAATLGFLARSG